MIFVVYSEYQLSVLCIQSVGLGTYTLFPFLPPPPRAPLPPPVTGRHSVVLHVASPGLPESALRLLFYRAVSAHQHAHQHQHQHQQHRQHPPPTGQGTTRGDTRNTVAGGGDGVGGKTRGGGGGATGGGGGGIVEAVTAWGLARAVVDYPLACEGLAPLIGATATPAGVRELLKQAVFQATEAVEETAKVVTHRMV